MSGMIGNMALLFVIGLLVNVPYALITTSISADLGTRLKSSKALATVTGILDGTGSIGAAVGPLMAGYLSFYGWQYIFYVLLAANGMALLVKCKFLFPQPPFIFLK
jgi:OPA family glycerol-3-phosphate transporter-like MFS transporter 1/2